MAARRPFVAGNWKMHKNVAESAAMVRELRGLVSMVHGVRIGIAPPFTAIHPVARALDDSNVEVGGQNLHWEKQGAYTGEVAGAMLKEAGCSFVIVGHSERRQYFGETDESVRKRTEAALAAGLTPVVCVGETLAERESGRTFAVVEGQLKGALGAFGKDDLGKLAIAYEPVWAIGTGKTATSAQAQEVHAEIRKLLRVLGGDVADTIPLMYGGSVKADNAAELMEQPDVDGALVGGASLTADSFAKIVKAAKP